MNETLTRSKLALVLGKAGRVSRQDASLIIETLLSEMSQALCRGDSVKVASFGTFCVRDKVSRVGRNPRTGQEAPITARKVVTFKASQALRKKVEKACQHTGEE